MNLGDFLERKDTKKKDYYWALVIEPGWIQAGIWEIVQDKANVISVSPPAPWEGEEEALGACDTALSAAIQNLPQEGIEPTKTVFGVSPSWVSGGQISEEYLLKIKKICSELSLEPTGFVVLPEAIAHLVRSEEGVPANSIVLGIGDETIDLAVFRLGNLTGTTTVARSVSISDDVAEGLTRLGEGELLPSRLLIYDGKEGELGEDRQALLASDWTERKGIKFLHTPQIETVSPDKKVLAVALAGASEIGHVSEIAPTIVPGPKLSDLGFAIGQDVAEAEISQPEEERVEEKAKETPLSIINKVKIAGGSIVKKFQPHSFGEASGRKTLILALSLVVVASAAFWWYYPKADVVIYVSPKKIEEKSSLFVDTKGGKPDFSRLTIPGEIIKTEVSGDKTKGTTGTKVVGEKAKGAVKIENGTANAINFPAGTIIASGSNLRFALDETASVSAALSPGNPGTAIVATTAFDIGADYNLASGEAFKVGNYPKAEVDAIATSNFSGGSSRQISAVSADDQKSLFADEESELLDNGKNQLLSNLSSDKYLISESVNATASSIVYSAKVGDEAGTLKISLELAVSGMLLSKSNLYDFAGNVMRGKVPSGFNLRDEQMTFSFEPKGVKGTTHEFEMTVLGNLLPEVKADAIAKSIVGKYPDAAESYLGSIPGFTRAEIKLKPRLPGRFGTLPRIPKHIFVSVAAER